MQTAPKNVKNTLKVNTPLPAGGGCWFFWKEFFPRELTVWKEGGFPRELKAWKEGGFPRELKACKEGGFPR